MRSRRDGAGERRRTVAMTALLTTVLLSASLGASVGMAAAQSESGIQVSLHPVRDQVAPGETVQVGVTVKNVGDAVSPAPVLALDDLPQGWTVESWAGTDATYRNSTNEWLWTKLPAGDVRKFTITLAVSGDASGDATVAATLTDGQDRQATAATTLTVSGGQATTAEATTTDDGGDSDLERVRTAVESPGFGVVPAALAVAVAGTALAARGRRRY